MSPRPLKVWHIDTFCTDANGDYGQHVAFIAARTKTEAARLIDTTMHHFNGWGEEGCNAETAAVVLASGEPCVFVKTGDVSGRTTAANLWPARLVGNRLTIVED